MKRIIAMTIAAAVGLTMSGCHHHHHSGNGGGYDYYGPGAYTPAGGGHHGQGPVVVKPAPAKVPHTLSDLQAMPGYTQATLSAKKSAFGIVGHKWNAKTTWYYTRGKVVRGDKADARRLEPGAKVFYIK